MKQKEKLIKIIEQLLISSGKISIILSLILIILVSMSVIMRYLFSIGFTWLQDLYIWIHASVILMGIAYTSHKNGHVRIDLFYKIMSQKLKDLINTFGTLFFTIPLSIFICSKGYSYFLRSFLQNESSKETGGLPAIYILKFIIFLMGILLLLECVLQLYIKFFNKKRTKWK